MSVKKVIDDCLFGSAYDGSYVAHTNKVFTVLLKTSLALSISMILRYNFYITSSISFWKIITIIYHYILQNNTTVVVIVQYY